MIAEGLKFLAELITRGVAPQKIDTGDPNTVTVSIGGAVSTFHRAFPLRQHRVHSMRDFIEVLRKKGVPESTAIWFNDETVTAVLDDDEYRGDTVRLNLCATDAFSLITGFASQTCWMPHKDFVRLLRIQLAGVLPSSHLLELVRRVKFTSASNTEAVALRSKESLGRDISREVATEGGAIPETVVLDVPVWTTPGLDTSYRLTCAVEVDLERGMFALVPLPDEIERVENLAIEQIRERLADDLPEFAAFHGSP